MSRKKIQNKKEQNDQTDILNVEFEGVNSKRELLINVLSNSGQGICRINQESERWKRVTTHHQS